MAPAHTDRPNMFASARTLCAHQSANILSDRGYIDILFDGSLTSAEAGATIWSQMVKNDPEQRNFWDDAANGIEVALASGVISHARSVACRGLPERQAEYEKWATKAVEALVASAYAGMDVKHEMEVGFEEMKRSELQKARHVSCGRCSPVSSIGPRDLAMLDWDGPEPSIGRPSPVSSLLGASGEVDEDYLDLDSLAPLVQVASAERLTPVKARIVDC